MKVLDQQEGKNWIAYHGDCVEVTRGLPDESIHYSIFSPPFASLYTYSSSPRDIGNCTNEVDFAEHFAHLVPELFRITKPGRLLSFHCMQLPMSKVRDGEIGLKDFRGQLIALFAANGWVYHSEVCIFKDPVTAMQRTKALGLLHKQVKKDSGRSRQGIADYLVTMMKPTGNEDPGALQVVYDEDARPSYLVTMRKPGDNPEPIAHTDEEFPVEIWQRRASPVWARIGGVDPDGFAIASQDINPNETLQHRSARDEKDERHLCPLQTEVIERALKIWTNEGDTVFSPFGGIGSEPYVALRNKRRAVVVELKDSYYRQLVRNLAEASVERQMDLFGAA